jgi:hypothetical protein
MLAGSITCRFAVSTTNEAGAAAAPRGPTPHTAAAHITAAAAAAARAAAAVIAKPFEVGVRIVRNVLMVLRLRAGDTACVSPRAGAGGSLCNC